MPCTNAAKSPETADRDAPPSQPIRQTLPDCCARAASGHAAAPPMSVMNSRRLMRPSITGLRCVGGAAPHVRLQRLGDMQKKGPSSQAPPLLQHKELSATRVPPDKTTGTTPQE